VCPEAPLPRLRGRGRWRSSFSSTASRIRAAIEVRRSAAIRRNRCRSSAGADLVHGLGDAALTEKTIERNRELGVFEIPMGRWLLAAHQLRTGATDPVVVASVDTLNLLAEGLRAAGDSLGASQAQLYERRDERQNAFRNYSYVAELVPQRELAERALERLTAES
jgi:hypothetical protein